MAKESISTTAIFISLALIILSLTFYMLFKATYIGSLVYTILYQWYWRTLVHHYNKIKCFPYKLLRKLKSTNQSAKRFDFLRLPPELRSRVYELAFGPEDLHFTLTGHRGRTPLPYPALLRVSRLVRRECRAVLRGAFTFAISINGLPDLYNTLALLNMLTPSHLFEAPEVFWFLGHLRVKVGRVNIDLDRVPRTRSGWKIRCALRGPFSLNPLSLLCRRLADVDVKVDRLIGQFSSTNNAEGVLSSWHIRKLLECVFRNGVLSERFLNGSMPAWRRERLRPRLCPV